MSCQSIQLRGICYSGEKKSPAIIRFQAGLNVIWGASNTGKSFIIETLEFMLGAREEPKDFDEGKGYDTIKLLFEGSDGRLFTIQRSRQGGDYLLFQEDCLTTKSPEEGQKLSQTAQKENSLSSFLLGLVNLKGKKIRKSLRKSDTINLNFRPLSKFIIITERKIIRKDSPVYASSIVNNKTSDASIFKLLLTGLDDSSLISINNQLKQQETDLKNNQSRLEVTKEFIQELSDEIKAHGLNRSDIETLLERLQNTSYEYQQRLSLREQEWSQLLGERSTKLQEIEQISNRISQIYGLLSRFSLLSENYKVDIQRLQAIEESGSLFFYYETVENCPLCGAPMDEQHPSTTCDGNIQEIVNAATAEIEKIMQLSIELQDTISDLHKELDWLEEQKCVSESELIELKTQIRNISSPLENMQSSYVEINQQVRELERSLYLFERIDQLESKRRGIESMISRLKDNIKVQKQSNSNQLDSQLKDTSTYEAFSLKVQHLLEAWEYPESGRVVFQHENRDLVIAGKSRSSNGKGYCAITHAAMTIATLEHCKEKELPHPGFVVLDSPLLGYTPPDDNQQKGDNSLVGTDLKDKFYEYLSMHHSQNQIIIFENDNPPPSGLVNIFQTHFTRNEEEGRYGFFPMGDNDQE